MNAVTAVFKRIQLFFLAFTLASSSMMFAGLYSGKLERGTAYTSLAEKFATVIATSPALRELAIGTERASQSGQRVSASTQAGPLGPVPRISAPQSARSSLQALRQRQQQFIVVEEVATGGS